MEVSECLEHRLWVTPNYNWVLLTALQDCIPGLRCLMPIVATTEHYISTGYNNGVFRDRIVTIVKDKF